MKGRFKIVEIPHYDKSYGIDLAILHLDQQCLEDMLWERGKGALYNDVNTAIQDIPKIVIMHGTPYYPEMFPSDITEENYAQLGFTKEQCGMSGELIRRARRVIGSNTMVVNSYAAAAQWGFGVPIWHGMEPTEWLDLPKEPRVVTMLSPAGLDKYYDRAFLSAVKDELAQRDIEHCHITVDAQFKTWDEYRNFLGRSLLYFHCMREAPMSRGRTEAMLSGCCVLTTKNQDAEKFIVDGENGLFIRRNPKHVADLVELLFANYEQAVAIGQRGKATAQSLFHTNRYVAEWQNLINVTLRNYGSSKQL